MIWIDIPGGPPTYTAQQRRWTTRGGRPITYPDSRAKRTRQELTLLLAPHAPRTPYTGPIRLSVSLVYPYRKTERKTYVRSGAQIAKTTRPDADNLLKLLQDVMTDLGYWTDDALVYDLRVTKHWGPSPGIGIEITQDDETNKENRRKDLK